MSRVFNGSSDLLTNTDGVALGDYPLTLAAWVKRAAASGSREFIGGPVTVGDSNHRIGLTFETTNAAGALARGAGDQVATSTGTVTDISWHLIVGRYASSTSRFAVLDGTAGTESTASGNANFTTMNDMRIGASGSGVTQLFFAGKIFYFSIFNYVVDDSDIAALLAGTKTPLTLTTPATHFWDFSSSSLSDTGSVGGYTLTATGTTTDSDSPFGSAGPGNLLVSRGVMSGGMAGMSGGMR